MSDCIFCKIVSGEISASFVYQDEFVVAFDDVDPQAPVHTLIIPRKHIATLNEVQDLRIHEHMLNAAREIVKLKYIEESGYRLVYNCNADGGQEVFHLHLHVLGGRPLKWPPG